jgi:hypothetical protein
MVTDVIWKYVPFVCATSCGVQGIATRGSDLLPWRRKTNGKSGGTLMPGGEEIVHHFTTGTSTDCGVDLYNEAMLRKLKTNWQPTPNAVTCQRCS